VIRQPPQLHFAGVAQAVAGRPAAPFRTYGAVDVLPQNAQKTRKPLCHKVLRERRSRRTPWSNDEIPVAKLK